MVLTMELWGFIIKVPQGLEKNTSSVYITTSSLPSAYEAYLNQFQRDFGTFLRMRSEEMVCNGRMVLTFIGRSTLDDPLYRDCCHFWTLISESMCDLVFEGIMSASKVESLNMPFYDPSKEEVKEVIQNEGSFEINDLEIHGFDLGQSSGNNEEGGAGEKEAKCIRAVSESMLVAHFGDDIIDALFNKFAYHASQHAGCACETTVTLVVSLNRENNNFIRNCPCNLVRSTSLYVASLHHHSIHLSDENIYDEIKHLRCFFNQKLKP
ncbi:unnamed protein product [Brassica napus]|uniref:(rape) hypothetical protein n=1 Tax=Brassica napus TaxID=3708 RepID=A0A816M2K5_BRANA|nr:unnamed protein product [Brassica napus]